MNDSEILGRDLISYQQMLKSLISYQNGEISLNKLMADIEGLLNTLELASNEWKEKFRAKYNVFEVVIAVMFERTPPELDEHDKKCILATVKQLISLVENKMEDCNVKN